MLKLQPLTDEELRRDQEFVVALGVYYERQEAVDQARDALHRAATEVAIASEELGSLKSRAMLVAALMNLEAGSSE